MKTFIVTVEVESPDGKKHYRSLAVDAGTSSDIIERRVADSVATMVSFLKNHPDFKK